MHNYQEGVMNQHISNIIEGLMKSYKRGEISEKTFLENIKDFYFEDIGYAKVDHHRLLRRDFPEVVYGTNKTPAQILEISKSILKYSHILMVTRTDKEVYDLLKRHITDRELRFESGIIYTPLDIPEEDLAEGITVICGGTSDMDIADEAAITAYLMKNRVDKIYDIGVAGIHRLMSNKEKLKNSNVIVAVAGMEGALPGVVGAMVDCPVIGVPTSVGYGANLGGISALLTMLNSCSPGISVVNIDNGFGAGYTAGIINRKK
jgi:pyridinium-3,5-biscarboxylic acid mononucleotide synthase